MKYIEADRLRAEIEIKKKTEGWCEVGKDTADIYYARGVRFTCDFVLNLIDSLQQEMWKPSEEQMEALKLACKDAFECPEGGVPHMPLKSLISDLQKIL